MQKPDLSLGDEAVKVFINASGTAENISPQMTDFLHYLKTGMGDSPLVRKIDAQVKKARAHEEWKVEYMTWQLKFHDIWDDAREEGLEEGRKIGLEEGKRTGIESGKIGALHQLLQKGFITLEVAAREAEMTEEEFLQKALELGE